MRILHIAPFNTAGVPLTFVKAEREMGHESRLITLGKNPQNREEDVCLALPFLDCWSVRCVKRILIPKRRRVISYIADIPKEIPPKWKAGSWLERSLVRYRERIWKPRIEEAIVEFQLDDFDIYQLDGGLGFYRDGRFIQRLKDRGKQIICCYTGSDLRTRGVIPTIDMISDLNVTVEFDHLQYHPNIQHVPFPLELSQFEMSEAYEEGPIRIGHAPTNRAAKGSDIIISVVRKLEKKFPVKLILIENLPYQKAIEFKRTCHIFIDQIGDLGYGMNSLEALAMSIPVCSSLAPGFSRAYPDHPFLSINEDNLEKKMILLIENPILRQTMGKEGREWIQSIHDAKSVVKKIHLLAGLI